ncbi:MAG TPA: hypothetical protein PK771_09870 [Spirochaetota bacterium]|nr:hypothetical protein [Spirochaetota bacterium]
MNKLNLNFNSTGKFNIDVQDVDEGVELVFRGLVDDKDPELLLSNFFDEAHEKLVKYECKKVELNFRNLVFLNSSGIKVLIQWVTKDASLSSEKRYRYVMKINPNFHWQGNSCNMLKMLVPDLILILSS